MDPPDRRRGECGVRGIEAAEHVDDVEGRRGGAMFSWLSRASSDSVLETNGGDAERERGSDRVYGLPSRSGWMTNPGSWISSLFPSPSSY